MNAALFDVRIQKMQRRLQDDLLSFFSLFGGEARFMPSMRLTNIQTVKSATETPKGQKLMKRRKFAQEMWLRQPPPAFSHAMVGNPRPNRRFPEFECV
jgi:hypothetical protein